MNEYGLTDTEMKIICAQIERRQKYRMQFLRLRTDPCKNSMEAGYVFDPALHRFQALKASQYDLFKPNSKNLLTALGALLPMGVYGYFVYKQRTKFDQDCRCGRLRYKDRLHKLS